MEKPKNNTDLELKQDSLRLLEDISSDFSMIDNSCYYCHITSELSCRLGELNNNLFKVKGSVLVILVKGRLIVDINTDKINVEGPAAVSLSHGVLVNLQSENDQIDAHILIYSPSFLHDLNISFSSVSLDALISQDSPVMELREREVHTLVRYLSLINSVMSDHFNLQLNRHIISSMTSALFYQMMLLLYRRIDTNSDSHKGHKRNNYVQDFLRLAHLYFTTERSVSFYASQLFISPKYLSLLVKESTGRSAARWIDQFVIMEAKNLLRYSGKNVQQVAYALNFSNQSSFGKYFKHLTGMSPTEFQKQG